VIALAATNAVPLSDQAWQVVLWVTLALCLAWLVFVVLFTRYRQQHRPTSTGEAHTRGVETRAARRTTSVLALVVGVVVVVGLLVFVLGRVGDLFA
jgi:TRAP-type mannitol/chloroaromatic compound transport system permease large subunit